MIRYALVCADCEGKFEAWYANSAAYDTLAKAGQLDCAHCSGHRISKQIMAPAITGTREAAPPPDLPNKADLIAAARDHIARTHDYVGESFSEEVRAMHYGETDNRPVWGTATAEDAKTLNEEGIAAVPLPPALAPKPPKDELN